MSEHEHEWTMVKMHDNADRVRTKETCSCGVIRYGCKAKRLDADGQESWGPVDKQTYRYVDMGPING